MRTQASGCPERLSAARRVVLGTPSGERLDTFVAVGRRLRLLGLAGLAAAPGAALLIPHCRSVHTWGMRFALDVVFLRWPPDRAVAVVAEVRRDVPPLRLVASSGRDRRVAALELECGSARRLGLDGAGAAVTVSRGWMSTFG